MFKNSRSLKILQNVLVCRESQNLIAREDLENNTESSKENCSSLHEGTEMEYEVLSNIDYDETNLAPEFSDLQPGTYIIQNDCSLHLEKDETRVCGTPASIIISHDGSLQRQSVDSSTNSVSILMNSDLMPLTADDITEYTDDITAIQQQIVTEAHNNINKRQDNIEKAQKSLNAAQDNIEEIQHGTEAAHRNMQKIEEKNEDIRTNDVIPSNVYNQIPEQTITETLPTPYDDNLTHLNGTGEQRKRLARSDTLDHSVEENTTSVILSKKRKKKAHPPDWSANKNKEQREKGKPYLGKKKVDGKWTFVEPKNERNIKDRCNCKLSLKGNPKLQCQALPEEERQKCFKRFWNMSWKEKKVYVRMSSICKRKQRERCAGTSSRRENSVELYLSDDKGNRYRVCKRMFLNSLCVGEWVIKKWIINNDDDLPKNVPKNNVKDEQHRQLRRFFDSLPKLESHYCRKDSSKLYLEPLWTSKAQLYKAYKDDFCPREKAEPLSVTSFCNVFEDLNLSLFRPKKDLCDVCESFKTGNITESEYKIHNDMKDEARTELVKDTASNNEVFTMDLQSVLLSPRSNVSALYYKTKLIVHNFTLYDVRRNKGYCYIWNECEGKLTSNEFASIIVAALEKFITQNPIGDDQELILYSDGCTYQNRNAVLSNTLLNFSMLNKITIIQKILEKGHTQMECDSMHSVIERALRHKKINVPADYAYLAKVACKKNPYEVEYLYHHFFKDFETALPFYKSIRPGKRAGDPTVSNIRALKYVPDGKIFYKLRHTNTVWEELPIRMKKICAVPMDNIPKLYSERVKIKKEKYLHLQSLKDTMEKDYHKFYDDLPHF